MFMHEMPIRTVGQRVRDCLIMNQAGKKADGTREGFTRSEPESSYNVLGTFLVRWWVNRIKYISK